MRCGGLTTGCVSVALLTGLGGCMHRPSKAEMIGASAKILVQEPLCVLAPRSHFDRASERQFVDAKDRAAIEPLVAAGLLRFIDTPAGRPDDPERIWFELTPYGVAWQEPDCLVDRNAYPVEFRWGFRIGTPEVVKTYPLQILGRGECQRSASATFEYRMKLEPWFVRGRFKTNFAAGGAEHYFDTASNVGRAHVRYTSGDGRRWFEEKIVYGHISTPICEKLE